MLKIIRMIISIMIIPLAIYGIITGNNAAEPYGIFLFGIVLVMFGVPELLQRKRIGIFYVLAAAFMFFVGIRTTVFH